MADLPADELHCKESYDLSGRHRGHFRSLTMAHISFWFYNGNKYVLT